MAEPAGGELRETLGEFNGRRVRKPCEHDVFQRI